MLIEAKEETKGQTLTKQSISLKITNVANATDTEWDNIWENCEYATFFHSREWAEIWKQYTQGRFYPAAKILSFSDGTKVLLPLSRQKIAKGWMRSYISSPGGTYGGWLAEQPLSAEHLALLSRYMTTQLGNLFWVINPFAPQPHLNSINRDLTESNPTYVFDLSQDWDSLLRRMNKKQIPKAVRKAQRYDLQMEKLGAKDVPAYFEIYQNCQQRWKGSGDFYSIEMFDLIVRSRHCDFWGVKTPDGGLVCAGPIFKSKRHAVAWLSLAQPDKLMMRPHEFFYYHLFRWYKDQNFRWFDFNPSGGHPGVDAFKKKFGTDILPCPTVLIHTPFTRLMLKVRQSFQGRNPS